MNPFDQIELEKKTLGVILSYGERDSFTILSSIKREYFTNGMCIDVYDTIQTLIKTAQPINVLTVVDGLKKTGKLQGKSIAEISKLTQDVPMMQHQIDMLASGLIENFNKRVVGNWLGKHSNLYANGMLTLDGFMGEFKKLEDQIDYGKEPDRDIIDVFDDVLQDHDKAKQGQRTGLRLGHGAIADIVELEPVDVMVVAARPAMGKTAFAISTAKNLCLQDELQVALFVIEMSNNQLVRRLQANLARVNSNKIRKGTCTEDELAKIRAWRSNANIRNLHIFTGDHRVEDIALKCTKLKNTVGLDLIIVDYVQKVTSSLKGSSVTETDQVKQVTDDLKRLTQRLEVPQIQFSQLRRTGSKERPTLSDIKQTTAIEENASIVAFLHRPEYYGHETMPDNPAQSAKGICEFILAKNREDELAIRQFFFEPWYSSFQSVHNGVSVKKDSPGEQNDLPF